MPQQFILVARPIGECAWPYYVRVTLTNITSISSHLLRVTETVRISQFTSSLSVQAVINFWSPVLFNNAHARVILKSTPFVSITFSYKLTVNLVFVVLLLKARTKGETCFCLSEVYYGVFVAH